MTGIEWARPAGLALLLLPLLLWLLARRRAHPTPMATGTFALWKLVAAKSAHASDRTRRATPLAVWFAIVALVMGALALAGPRGSAFEPARRWTIVVDGSPSMGLPLGDASGPRRIDAALETAVQRLAARAADVDRVRWIKEGRPTVELAPGELPSDAWLDARPGFEAEPVWELYDDAGTIWITDRAPERAPERAGFVAVGGAAVPGAIATRRTDSGARVRVLWDGARSSIATGALERRTVVFERPSGSAGELFGALVELWARTSGYRVDARADEPALVVEVGVDCTERVAVEAEGHGWSLRGSAGAASSAASAVGEPWLLGRDASGATLAIVLASPGHVRIRLCEVDEPSGDPAAFAVAWSRLFDTCTLEVPGVVALDERRAAGDLEVKETARAPLLQVDGANVTASLAAGDPIVDAWLAGASTLLGLVALALSPRR